MSALHYLIAEKNIRLPRIVTTRWLLVTCRLSEKGLKEENGVHIRLATQKDIDFMDSSEGKNVPGRGVLAQNVRFWNKEGFRCVYVGCLKGEQEPSVMEYSFDDSHNQALQNMEYGGMYQTLSSDIVHNEGIYVRKEKRGNNLAFEFRRKLNKILLQRGKKWVRMHIPADETKISNFKSVRKSGFVPDHWITLVKIDLPFFRSMRNVFTHLRIKEDEFNKFPLYLF